MKKITFVKTFYNERELNEFLNTYVGTTHFWQTRPQCVNVDGLNVTISIGHGKYFDQRMRTYLSNGFKFEEKE